MENLAAWIISLLVQAIQKLGSKWGQRFVDLLDTKFLEMTSGHRRRYLDYIMYQHGNFDVKGLSIRGAETLKLEEIYVELSMKPEPVHHVSTDPVRPITDDGRSSSHTIWEYFDSKHLSLKNLAVIGPPGSGKSTLLKYVAVTLAQNSQRVSSKYIPILLFLRDHTKTIKANTDITLPQLIQDQSVMRQSPDLAEMDWLKIELDRGHCMIMLDGLDEIADKEARQVIVTWIEQSMVSYGKNRFVVTSRPHGYRNNPLENVTVLEIRPFTLQQVEKFVKHWYLSIEFVSALGKDTPGVRSEASQGAFDLLERIRSNAALSDLAVNPLLLTMIANVHRFRSKLPERRAELYSEICEVFLGKRQEARGLTFDLSPFQKQWVLRELAYHLMCKGLREISTSDAVAVIAETLASVSPNTSSDDFLKMIENSSGLLLERENGFYGFSHHTFQEYLASVHIREVQLKEALITQVNDPWWHETIRLFCAQADASPVIQACIEANSIEAYALGMECMDESGKVHPAVRKEFQDIIDRALDGPNLALRRKIAEARLISRLRR